jgi:hypothetical protein
MDEYYSVGTFLNKKFCPFLVNLDLNFSDFWAQASTNIANLKALDERALIGE